MLSVTITSNPIARHVLADMNSPPLLCITRAIHTPNSTGTRDAMSKIAVPLADDFEDTEFSVPLDRLLSEDHEIVVIGDRAGSEVEGKRHRVTAEVDMTAEGVDPLDFDMLLIPGGHSPTTCGPTVPWCPSSDASVRAAGRSRQSATVRSS